jgi:dihydropteroate synthase
MTSEQKLTMTWESHALELGRKTRIMGIVNVTPDSFSDGGRFFSSGDAIAHGEKLAADGADILDIGGESTRPGSEPISIEEEMHRVIPVIESLAARIAIPISIDTTKSAVARSALDAGACMINDISALRVDPELADVAATYNAPIILMHMKGTPKTMQVSPQYDDLIGEIKDFIEKAIKRAESKGISKSKIIVDPGIGFGKTFDQNLFLIQHLHEFNTLKVPLLVGPSRKAFIRNILKGDAKEEIDPLSAEVETGTQAAVAAAAINGAHIVRVHNVANTRSTLSIIDALRNARNDR